MTNKRASKGQIPLNNITIIVVVIIIIIYSLWERVEVESFKGENDPLPSLQFEINSYNILKEFTNNSFIH